MNVSTCTRTSELFNMHFYTLAGIFSILISTISAISILNFPLNLRVQPGSDLNIQLADNNLVAGDRVRVELWDNQEDEDINAAVLGEDLIVNKDLSVDLSIPSHFPKTKNAFLRVYYKCYNTVSPRFSIKPENNNCMTTRTPIKPTIMPTPVIIYQSPVTATAAPVVVIAGGADGGAIAGGAGGAGVAGIAGGADVVMTMTGTASMSTATRSSTAKASSAARSTSTSTSSASVAKMSVGSVVVAVAVAFAMLF